MVVDPNDRERISVLWDEVQTVDEQMMVSQPGAMPGEVNITMGEPQVINLDGGGDLNAQIQQAMQLAQQAMSAPTQGSGNLVEDRIAQLERLAKLRDSGVLSDAEFEAEKARVLAGG